MAARAATAFQPAPSPGRDGHKLGGRRLNLSLERSSYNASKQCQLLAPRDAPMEQRLDVDYAFFRVAMTSRTQQANSASWLLSQPPNSRLSSGC
jgi:hypothetical protein